MGAVLDSSSWVRIRSVETAGAEHRPFVFCLSREYQLRGETPQKSLWARGLALRVKSFPPAQGAHIFRTANSHHQLRSGR
jgi:hypothetical protein